MDSRDLAIDVVYAWVDGSDPGLHEDMRRWAERPEHLNPERTRDPYDVFRYSLRSVARYAPWVRRVHILTQRPQAPAWLERAHPRVRVVHHDEIPGFAPYLPTFNSNGIETFLHAIPGLADDFIYLNDDFLLGAPNTPADYVAADGRHLLYGTWFGLRIPFRVYQKRWKLYNAGRIEHTPRFYHKAFYEEMLAAYPAALDRTRARRFRRGDDLRLDRCYRMWMLGRHPDRVEVVPGRALLRYHRFHRIGNDLERERRRLAELRALAPKFYCLNDDQGRAPNQAVCAHVREVLAAWYPEPCEFERSAA